MSRAARWVWPLVVPWLLAACRETQLQWMEDGRPPSTGQLDGVPTGFSVYPGTTETGTVEIGFELEDELVRPFVDVQLTLRRHIDDELYEPITLEAEFSSGDEQAFAVQAVLDAPATLEDGPGQESATGTWGRVPFDDSCVPGSCTWTGDLALTHVEGEAPVAVRADLILYFSSQTTPVQTSFRWL